MKAIVIAFAILASSVVAEESSKFQQAFELYKQGPTKGDDVVRLLRQHLETNPKDLQAMTLLGVTLFGLRRPEEALPAFDSAIAISAERPEIRPKTIMLKVRTLYELRRFDECRKFLDAYWAFWQNDPELKKQYEWYYPRVANSKASRDAGPSDRNADIADAAIDVISASHPTPGNDYLLLMFASDRLKGIVSDADLGAFVRHMQKVKSSFAVVATPTASGDRPTHVVYFDGSVPLGLVTIYATRPKPSDEEVAQAYVRVFGPQPKQERQTLYQAGHAYADDGTLIPLLKIIGMNKAGPQAETPLK